MSVYLHDIPLNQAQAKLQQALQSADLWRVLSVEEIPLNENALGRVTAQAIWAKISSPHYHASAMDGFAVRAEDTIGAGPTSPIQLPITNYKYIDTGDPLPDWANAVIPIENVEALDENGNITTVIRQPSAVRIRASVTPWSHVRPLGEDIVATQLVLPAGHILRPVDLGAIAASGHQTIKVSRKPKVAILPTGSELVPIGINPKSGEILEYNSLVLASQIKQMGGEATRFEIVKDDFDLICEKVLQASNDYDLILLNAGSSAGAEDFSAKVVEKLGTLLVHGVAVRPGHPVILGMVKKEFGNRESENLTPDTSHLTPIIGVPGYPVSASLTVDIFVEPVLAKWLGRKQNELQTETAILTRKIVSPAGDDDFVRVAVGKVGDKLLAAPLSRGAGVITSLVQADGLALIPSGTQGVDAGEKIQVKLYRTKSEIEKTILAIGSHDLTLDLMAQFLAEKNRRLASANVGSQGGLVALRRDEAHFAGSHLLDPNTGEFNISYIRQYMPNIKVKVVALVGREQGLIVKKGNPKGIKSLGDLAGRSQERSVQFVNRQKGSGTRTLLDYHLNQLNIPHEYIAGYHQDEYTHLGVATAVASGRADCGLGIAAAAQALDLDFIPLFQERYDLVIPKQFVDFLTPLFDLLTDSRFQHSISLLKGYDVSIMGTIILEDE
jgi:putative molybdopterin biosynthesis protein